MGDSDSSVADGDDRAGFELRSVSLDHLTYQGDPFWHGHIREAHQAGVQHAIDVHQLSEVGVDRDQDPALGTGPFEQSPIAGIRFELTRLEDVMALDAQPVGQPRTGAPVYEELHRSDTEMAASVSREITACAYATHARMSSDSSSG